MPFPSMRTLSDRSGVSERQIQRSLKSLESKGYFKKLRKQVKTVISSNVYDLGPLVKILDEVAGHYGNAHPRRLNPSGATHASGGQEMTPSDFPKSPFKSLAGRRRMNLKDPGGARPVGTTAPSQATEASDKSGG